MPKTTAERLSHSHDAEHEEQLRKRQAMPRLYAIREWARDLESLGGLDEATRSRIADVLFGLAIHERYESRDLSPGEASQALDALEGR